jgi:hypothetical protein
MNAIPPHYAGVKNIGGLLNDSQLLAIEKVDHFFSLVFFVLESSMNSFSCGTLFRDWAHRDLWLG